MVTHLAVRESVAAPPDQVMAALTDYDRLPHWMLNVVGFEKLTEGPLGSARAGSSSACDSAKLPRT
jgi:carbon monoxide dehydrogenase subunit G